VWASREGGYQARALGSSIFTEADTLDELKAMIRDAVSCHFEKGQKPSVIRLHMLKDEVLPARSFPATSATKNSFDHCAVLATKSLVKRGATFESHRTSKVGNTTSPSRPTDSSELSHSLKSSPMYLPISLTREKLVQELFG
jgi:hypothetical protein